MAQVFVVTGANGGLGLEFVKEISAKGHIVIACARNPDGSDKLNAMVNGENVHAVAMDNINEDSIKTATEKIEELAPNGIDVLINNAGITGGGASSDATSTKGDEYIKIFETNVVGTSNVTQALLPLLRKRETRRIVNISSIMGSIKNTNSSIGASYRVSKAAENMLTRMFAGQLGREGFVVLAMHPGWVRAGSGSDDAPYSAEESISGILAIIDKMSPEMNGKFMSFLDKEVPW
ncbi:4-dihydrotrisporin dehydrogenase [Fennellomyces sp. T-0311]|nr:4-dihydrotrisporin dehydrogenase [Fennellomyces sp. T-0311]